MPDDVAQGANPINLKVIDHVVFRVKDVAAMIAFYRDVLGCRLEKVQERIGLYQLRAGESLIDLVDVEGELGRAGGAAPGREGRNLDHVCLQVMPFDAETIRTHLKAHGVDPGEVVSRYGALGAGPSIYIEDPEGNTVELKGPPGSLGA
jgi:catechol 2,3-dioxygenase-like lactoylglutathione lyase family enzyme